MPFSSHINALPLSHEPRPPSFVTEGNRKGTDVPKIAADGGLSALS
jgi:hypothetical protein